MNLNVNLNCEVSLWVCMHPGHLFVEFKSVFNWSLVVTARGQWTLVGFLTPNLVVTDLIAAQTPRSLTLFNHDWEISVARFIK